jgi:tetratricopeptide (TPR) repeat protein
MTRTRSAIAGLAFSGALSLLPAPSAAQTAKPTTPSLPSSEPQLSLRPWANGVTPEQQKAAQGYFLQGNTLLREALFVQAAEKYRQALAEWNHPGIHYNLALALLNLDQPVEIHEHLEAALKYGPAPLDAEKYEHAKSYLTLVEKQLAPLDVSCDVPDAKVTLDGQLLFEAPGKYRALVRPGSHTVVATKPGFVPTERTKIMLPGQATTFRLQVYTENELIGYRHRWPVWQPIALTAAGAVFLAGGGILTVQSKNSFNSYDERLRTMPECRTGCVPDESVTSLKTRGETLQKLSFVSYGVGGAALAVGVVLLLLNRSTPYRIEPAEGKQSASVVPFLGPREAGIVGTARF